MQDDHSRIVSNFEINRKEGKVVLFINPRIFPLSLVKQAAAKFEAENWTTIDVDPKEDLLVELKPKGTPELEKLGREFNNALLELSTENIKIDEKDSALVSRIRGVIKDFLAEEKGKVTKEAV